MRVSSVSLFVFVPLLFASACSRTGLWELIPETEQQSGGRSGRNTGGSAGRSEPECTVSSDCPLVDLCTPPICVMPESGAPAYCEARAIDCEDGDPCTLDRCDPELGVCESTAPADMDRDGFLGEAPAGAGPNCGGQDCDDLDAAVFPGAREACNGKDDDCDGNIDEDSDYWTARSPIQLAPNTARSQHGGIIWNGQAYGVSYSSPGPTEDKQSYFGLLEADGERKSDPALVSEINADTYAGAVGWSGDSFLTTWSDARRAGNYEIYATRFDTEGRELSADTRLTEAPDFSLRPVLRFNGSEYLLIWDDHRFDEAGGALAIYGRRISVRGAMLGGEIRITPESENAEFGALAVGKERVAVAYVVTEADPNYASVRVRTFDQNFEDGSGPLELTGDGQDPSIVPVDEGFLVAWHTGSEARNFGPVIEAALIDRQGNLLARGPVTSGDSFARWRTLVSLGDRVLLIWSGAGADGLFALYYQVLDGLTPISARRLLTTSSTGGLLVDPVAARGPTGDIGVLYDDNQSGVYTAFFARLTCLPDFEIR